MTQQIKINQVNDSNDINKILGVGITKKNEYFHFIKGSFLLKKYLNESIDNIDNLKNQDINDILTRFTNIYSKCKFKKDINDKFNTIKGIIEEVKDFLNPTIIKIGIDNLMKRVKKVNFEKF